MRLNIHTKKILIYLIPLAYLTACSDSSSGPNVEAGAIRIITATTGADRDLNGYAVSLDGETRDSADVNDEILISGLSVGLRQVALSDISTNCTVQGNNPRTVSVVDDSTSEVNFDITCAEVVLRDKIVFSKTESLNLVLNLMNSDGSEVGPIGTEIIGGSPVISPDGMAVVFSRDVGDPNNSNFEIFISDADGDPIKQITSTAAMITDANPVWSPDGSKLAFVRDDQSFEDIAVINANGTGLVNLTSNSQANDSHPSWSPDGSKIAFSSDRNQQSSIFVMDPDGTNVVQLTAGDTFESQPSWSPDGTKIAFVGIRNGFDDVFVMDADGSNMVQLTDDENSEFSPEWSPDGIHIIFQRSVGSQNDIFRINSDGSGLINLTDTANDNELNPHWSPVQN